MDLDPGTFNIVNPITGIYVFPNGVLKVKRESLIKGRFQYEPGRRGKPIMKFTAKSMARLVATVNATTIQFNSMITLTYPMVYPKSGKIIKAAMNSFTQMMRDQDYGPYLWFLEFQSRGAPHFHILSTQKGISPAMRVRVVENWVARMSKEEWFEMECHSLAVRQDTCAWKMMANVIAKSYWFTLRSETWELLRSVDGGRRYATTYATKQYQKKPPGGFEGIGRFWGCSKQVILSDGVYKEMGEEQLRAYLDKTDHATKDWQILPKYLFGVEQETDASCK